MGGGMSLITASTLSLTNSTIDACAADHGAGLHILDATVNLARGTHLSRNVGAAGAALWIGGTSLVDYALPAPPGTWIPASQCEVYREACPENPATLKAACEASRDSCSKVAGATNVSAGGTPCQPATFNRQCRTFELRACTQVASPRPRGWLSTATLRPRHDPPMLCRVPCHARATALPHPPHPPCPPYLPHQPYQLNDHLCRLLRRVAEPCAWHRTPEQIGETVFVLPTAPVAIDFPYNCAPGL
eukprot:1623339-Prymnesium_polylepis.1